MCTIIYLYYKNLSKANNAYSIANQFGSSINTYLQLYHLGFGSAGMNWTRFFVLAWISETTVSAAASSIIYGPIRTVAALLSVVPDD